MSQNPFPPESEAEDVPSPVSGRGWPAGSGEGAVDADSLSSSPSPTGERGDLSAADIDVAHARQVLEAALLSATEPMQSTELRRMFEPDLGAELVGRLLADIQQEWQGKAVELMRLASGWRFQTRAVLQPYLDRLRQTRAPRYSRAVLETLAIIVYRQPVTRGDIEEIRGVAVSANIINLLETRGWIDTIGHRDTPGRPALFATTRKFLDDLGLRSLTELPPLSSLSDIEGVLDLVDTAESASPSDAP
ncbi:MAG: scpB [Rhodocyclales bacterium]|nr:scpB [Rhodocyclales bacterium]